MNDQAKDYPEEDTDHEEVVLNRWQRIKQWFEIAMATKKVAMLVWSLVVGTAGTAIYGNVTDTKPLHEAAVAVGLVEKKEPVLAEGAEYVTAEEFRSFMEWQRTHTHDFTVSEHSHDLIPHEHPDKPHTHADHIHADHTHPEISAQIKAQEVSGGNPVGMEQALDDAFRRHVEQDH